MTLPNDQEQTSNVPVRFTELDQIKQNVQEIKTSVDQYKQQKDFLDKKKSTLAKDVVKQKQSLIDAKELEIEAKKKETLALIAKLKIDTKLTVLDTTISQEIAADESYLKTLNIKDSSFWEKTYCWMKEHKK